MSGLDRDTLDEFDRRCKAERVAAGLPERIEDPEALDRVARIVADAKRRSA